ncbi:hypothetical protein O181_026463 [Austropuccinia psidii MF-1]|uniref:Uncharacterized protein n=1 Tax=Austropuccinia psidii MF-1 TaxID=1389203 RepID=A0A9Q3CPU2_9BASI|nr:hypothetical protein [Austropuccinia psidii MF-1]
MFWWYLGYTIGVNELSQVNLELENFNLEQMNAAAVSLCLTAIQENELSILLYDHKEAFEKDKEQLGAIIGTELDLILNIERPYPSLLRRPAYLKSPKSRETPELHI